MLYTCLGNSQNNTKVNRKTRAGAGRQQRVTHECGPHRPPWCSGGDVLIRVAISARFGVPLALCWGCAWPVCSGCCVYHHFIALGGPWMQMCSTDGITLRPATAGTVVVLPLCALRSLLAASLRSALGQRTAVECTAERPHALQHHNPQHRPRVGRAVYFFPHAHLRADNKEK